MPSRLFSYIHCYLLVLYLLVYRISPCYSPCCILFYISCILHSCYLQSLLLCNTSLFYTVSCRGFRICRVVLCYHRVCTVSYRSSDVSRAVLCCHRVCAVLGCIFLCCGPLSISLCCNLSSCLFCRIFRGCLDRVWNIFLFCVVYRSFLLLRRFYRVVLYRRWFGG